MDPDQTVPLGAHTFCFRKIVQHKLFTINRGSYMSAHVLLNLLNELGKRYKMRGLKHIRYLQKKK